MANDSKTWRCGKYELSFDRPRIMGVLNVTPDSFSDGGEHFDADAAIEYGLAMLDAGADIIDVGGESTRPGFTPVNPDEEARRVLPVVRALAKEGAIVSIDTRHVAVAKAAVRCGADAVYLGGRKLNARRNAANFSDEELAQAVEYCHAREVKVYITLNTLVRDDETQTAMNAVRCACDIKADALILQDIGLASLVRRAAPDMPLHASTQTSVQTLDGIKLLADLGFCRAVLPRELSKKEIEKIAAQSPIELELFVHGALCMCLSGQCQLSAVLGSRSGNRGLCAQPCRLPFSAEGGTGHDLSLKDMSLIEYLPELAQMGITSFKIEGRMKRPE